MNQPIPPRPGLGARKARLAEILRVDQAGELAAVHIYRGQQVVMRNAPGRDRIANQLKDMEGHEQVHLSRFDELLGEHQVRPTLMSPVWRAAAFALGAGTALLGEKAAHACTEAVESVIEQHYAGQIAELEARDPTLAAELSQFRDDELHHKDIAIGEGAREALGYPLLSAVIKAGCRAAIKISEKI
uniref:3-demethoxyubiquinol 3-hydroxylase n=1 Tax=Caulobacter sp. (strain K31) TaxID=366602 RepID=B0T2S4_CAUSK